MSLVCVGLMPGFRVTVGLLVATYWYLRESAGMDPYNDP